MELIHFEIMVSVLLLLVLQSQIAELFLRESQRLSDLIELLLVHLALRLKGSQGGTVSRDFVLEGGNFPAQTRELILHSRAAHQRNVVIVIPAAKFEIDVCSSFSNDERPQKSQWLMNDVMAVDCNDDITRRHRPINISGSFTGRDPSKNNIRHRKLDTDLLSQLS